MMRTLLASGVLMAMTFLLQGCVNIGGSSPDTKYYLLTAKTENPATIANPVQTGLVSVGPILIPEFLDRPQIVTRDGARVQVADLHRWAEPLESSLIRVISENLERLHPGWKAVGHLAPQAMRAERSLRLKVRRFDGIPGKEAILDIDWQLTDLASTNTSITGRFHQAAPIANAGYEALVDSFSQGLAQLCREIPLR